MVGGCEGGKGGEEVVREKRGGKDGRERERVGE